MILGVSASDAPIVGSHGISGPRWMHSFTLHPRFPMFPTCPGSLPTTSEPGRPRIRSERMLPDLAGLPLGIGVTVKSCRPAGLQVSLVQAEAEEGVQQLTRAAVRDLSEWADVGHYDVRFKGRQRAEPVEDRDRTGGPCARQRQLVKYRSEKRFTSDTSCPSPDIGQRTVHDLSILS